ncbi:MAG: ribonuclease, partial [Bacteroidota bacterium]
MPRKEKKKRNKEYKRQPTLYKGRLEITRSGMGFVVVEGLEKDVIIRPNDFNKAFHGDLVRVEVTKGDAKSGRMQGVIV